MRSGSITYLLLGLYAVMINWYYNHNVIDVILSYIFSPFYLIYAVLNGNLSHGMWYEIPNSYFR